MNLQPKALALSLGILWGVLLFLITNISLLRGSQGEHLSLLSLIYVGYSFSFVGSLVGMIWGFVSMFIGGSILAWLYNRFTSSSSQSTS